MLDLIPFGACDSSNNESVAVSLVKVRAAFVTAQIYLPIASFVEFAIVIMESFALSIIVPFLYH